MALSVRWVLTEHFVGLPKGHHFLWSTCLKWCVGLSSRELQIHDGPLSCWVFVFPFRVLHIKPLVQDTKSCLQCRRYEKTPRRTRVTTRSDSKRIGSKCNFDSTFRHRPQVSLSCPPQLNSVRTCSSLDPGSLWRLLHTVSY